MVNWLGLFELALVLLRGAASAAGAAGLAELAAGIQAGLKELESVHGTEVTRAQLESLRG